MAMQNNSFSVLFFIYFLDTNVEGSTDGLLAYWKFNEGNGKTIKDHSGNGNTLEAEKRNPTWVSVALPKKNNIKFNTKKYETKDRKSTRLNSSHNVASRMPSSA